MYCELDWSGRLLTVRASGRLTHDELLQGAREITADTRYDQLRSLVLDFLLVESSSAFMDAVEDLLVIMIGATASNPNVRIAVLSTDAHVVDLVAALNAEPTDQRPSLRAFADRVALHAWLAEGGTRNVPSMRFRPR